MKRKITYTWAFSLLPLSVMGLLPARRAAADDGVPTIAKDSLQVTAYTQNVYRKSYDVWSWTPRVEFEVNGPILERKSALCGICDSRGTSGEVRLRDQRSSERPIVEDRLRRPERSRRQGQHLHRNRQLHQAGVAGAPLSNPKISNTSCSGT
jgi:hypothetical protein